MHLIKKVKVKCNLIMKELAKCKEKGGNDGIMRSGDIEDSI